MPPFEIDSRTKAQGIATTEAAKFGKPLSFYTEGLISNNESPQPSTALSKNRNWIFKEKKEKKAPSATGTSSQIRISKNVDQQSQYPLIMSKKSKTILDQKTKQITDKEQAVVTKYFQRSDEPIEN